MYFTFDIPEGSTTYAVRAVGAVVRVTEGTGGRQGLAVKFEAASMDIERITWFVRRRLGRRAGGTGGQL